MKLCLNMIVKNEAARIVRALDSVVQFIDCYAITDTGSTDDTPKVIRDYFDAHKIPGIIHYAPFKDWSQARNAALITARAMRPRHQWDYAILMDADMELVVKDFPAFLKRLEGGGLSYDMEQRMGSLHYANRRLISAAATGVYKGVTHEYLDVDSAGSIPADVAYFNDHADGANRPEKYKRDIRLLLEGLEQEPNNSRYYYYLAQSYRDAGDTENAKLWYKKRVEAGGWDEERWNAQLNYAHCFKDQGDEGGFIREMLVAYNMRPTRAESLYDLAHYFRMKDDKQAIAALFAEVGMAIPRPNDLLFVNDFVYQSGLKEEFAITGFYSEAKRPRAFQVCSDLSLHPGPYPGARHTARFNLYFYLPTLGNFCPTFKSEPIKFTPPEGWVALNPSVSAFGADQKLMCVVRTVNYQIDEHGRYLIRGTDGTANATNPINTRNWLLDLDSDPFGTPAFTGEIINPSMPCEFPLVVGFEDMRLFEWKQQIWTSSTVRQIHPDGNCEQVLARIEYARKEDTLEPTPRVVEYKRMLREPRATEKNWAPIPNARVPDDLLFMWRPGVTIDPDGKFVHNEPPNLTTDIICGGTQLVPFAMGYLAIVHSANTIPGSSCRYYFHRFAVYDMQFRLLALSLPFVFHEKQIEYAAGLARHPTDRAKFVISYGVKDNEARIATITEHDVARFIWAPFK